MQMKVKYIIPYKIVVWRIYLITFFPSRGIRNKNNCGGGGSIGLLYIKAHVFLLKRSIFLVGGGSKGCTSVLLFYLILIFE